MTIDTLSAFLIDNPEQAWKQAGKPEVDYGALGREKALAWLKQAQADFKANHETPKRGAYKIKRDIALFTLKVGRNIVPIAGNERNAIARDKFAAFLDTLTKHIEAGAMDPDLTIAMTTTNVSSNIGNTLRSTARAEWSDEKKSAQSEKLKAAWARRKAAAGK